MDSISSPHNDIYIYISYLLDALLVEMMAVTLAVLLVVSLVALWVVGKVD